MPPLIYEERTFARSCTNRCWRDVQIQSPTALGAILATDVPGRHHGGFSHTERAADSGEKRTPISRSVCRPNPLRDRPSLPGHFAKLVAKRDFAAHVPRKALEEPLEVGSVNDEAQARHSG